jgi:hypothetical protein
MKTKIKIVPIFLIIFLLSQSSSAQDWFPLEVGNRWDYSVRYLNHGGTYIDTIFVEIIDEVVLNNKKYYNCSNPLFFGGERLFVENDSLYIYDSMDSTDCLVFAFNLSDSTGYKPCLFDTAIVIGYSVFNIFGYEDTTQIQVTSYDNYEFSKKFGFKFKARYNTLDEIEHQLSGCIISGVTYGELLVSVENETESPKEFSLFQNYPNPFNPSTMIRYEIPGQADNMLVVLKVYDVLGNEIAILVNEELPAGEYEVEFNSHSGEVRNLVSGIYFYQLRSGSFIETKKMILVK